MRDPVENAQDFNEITGLNVTAPTTFSAHNRGFPEKYCRRSLLSFFSFIRLFWNQILTWRSVRFSILDSCSLFSLLIYTLKKNSRSNSRIWNLEYGHLFFLVRGVPEMQLKIKIRVGSLNTSNTSRKTHWENAHT